MYHSLYYFWLLYLIQSSGSVDYIVDGADFVVDGSDNVVDGS